MFTYRFSDKLLQHPMKLVPHVVHILFNIILGVVPLLLQSVLHDHLTLRKVRTGTVQHFSEEIIKPGKLTIQWVEFNHESARWHQVPHSPQKDSACQLPVATVDCFQLEVPAFLFWLSAFWLGAAGQTFSHPCPPLWWSKKIQENNQKSHHSTTLTQLLTASLKKSWFGWDFYPPSGEGLGTLPSFLIPILHKTELLTSISSFAGGFSSGSFGLSPWFCCSSWSVCILLWWTNTFGH